jgi:hypothetical protein
MIKSVKVATLVSAMLFSAGVLAQANSDVVTKPAPSSESKAPHEESSKSRSGMKDQSNADFKEVLKPGQSGESRPPATDVQSGKTRADVKNELRSGKKKGTTPDGMNEPDSAYQKTPSTNKGTMK